MHEQYHTFSLGDKPLKCISDKKMYVPYMYMKQKPHTILYFDGRSMAHIISGKDAEEYAKTHMDFEKYLGLEKNIYFPTKFLEVTIRSINPKDPLRKFYDVCKKAVLVKGFPLTVLTDYGSIVGKIHQPSFVKNGKIADCRIEVALTLKGEREYKKYLKKINEDVKELITGADAYEKIGKPITDYTISRVYMTHDKMVIFEYQTRCA